MGVAVVAVEAGGWYGKQGDVVCNVFVLAVD